MPAAGPVVAQAQAGAASRPSRTSRGVTRQHDLAALACRPCAQPRGHTPDRSPAGVLTADLLAADERLGLPDDGPDLRDSPAADLAATIVHFADTGAVT